MFRLKHLLHEVGFSSTADLVMTIFGYRGVPLTLLQFCVAGSIGLADFVEEWVFQPPTAVFILAALIAADTVLGTTIAARSGEKISPKKLTRMMPIMLSHMALMAAAFWLCKADDTVFSWLPSTVFGFLGFVNFMSVARNLVTLGMVRGSVVEAIAARIASTHEILIQDSQLPKFDGKTQGTPLAGVDQPVHVSQ